MISAPDIHLARDLSFCYFIFFAIRVKLLLTIFALNVKKLNINQNYVMVMQISGFVRAQYIEKAAGGGFLVCMRNHSAIKNLYQ